MKNIVFGLIATVLFGNLSFGQNKISFLDIKGKEIAIIVDNADNSFKEYYLFQYQNQDFSKLSSKIVTGFVEIINDNLIIKSNDVTFTFALNNNGSLDNIYYGYGLSHRIGEFKIMNIQNPLYIYDLIVGETAIDGSIDGSTGSLSCNSRGKKSSECSVKDSTINVGAAECSVKCDPGFYACCDDTIGECRCIEEKNK
jgi:hypothetical protein